jgi:hypothetical protein
MFLVLLMMGYLLRKTRLTLVGNTTVCALADTLMRWHRVTG